MAAAKLAQATGQGTMSDRSDHTHLEEVSADQALEELSTDPDEGLTSQEAGKRLEEYGENAIEEERKNPLLRFFSHFWGPIPWMIEVAVLLSAAVQRCEDSRLPGAGKDIVGFAPGSRTCPYSVGGLT